MSEKQNEAQRIAGDLRSWIQQPEHGPLMWMRDAIPPRRVAEFADRVESLGESGECADAPAEVTVKWAISPAPPTPKVYALPPEDPDLRYFYHTVSVIGAPPDPDCETCDTRIEYEGLHERIAELEAERRTWVTMAYHEEALDRVKAEVETLRSVILCIRRMAWDALGPDMTLAKIKANVAAIHNATEADSSEALRPVPEPSDALARATEAMDRLPHETVILGRINHLGTAIGAIIYHLKGGKP